MHRRYTSHTSQEAAEPRRLANSSHNVKFAQFAGRGLIGTVAKNHRWAGYASERETGRRLGLMFVGKRPGDARDSDYSSDSIVRSSRKRISSSLLASEITKRTRPWLEVLA